MREPFLKFHSNLIPQFWFMERLEFAMKFEWNWLIRLQALRLFTLKALGEEFGPVKNTKKTLKTVNFLWKETEFFSTNNKAIKEKKNKNLNFFNVFLLLFCFVLEEKMNRGAFYGILASFLHFKMALPVWFILLVLFSVYVAMGGYKYINMFFRTCKRDAM